MILYLHLVPTWFLAPLRYWVSPVLTEGNDNLVQLNEYLKNPMQTEQNPRKCGWITIQISWVRVASEVFVDFCSRGWFCFTIFFRPVDSVMERFELWLEEHRRLNGALPTLRPRTALEAVSAVAKQQNNKLVQRVVRIYRGVDDKLAFVGLVRWLGLPISRFRFRLLFRLL